ncbi:helix-turn-helix domain-containing protein [Acidianus manzaensis]|uniref:Helix-turn-helix domain-containing protein n=1 Tax=Acidianus manzaensis TaxID=282676 RepID=A0A1W6JWN9_9CREN|nr:helix-turn-helix domain-containing protein [Acidianus manzaensis]
MRNNLKEVILAINHESCWTSLVGDYVVKTMYLTINPEKNFIRSIILLDKKYKNLISEIKKTKSFVGYNHLSISEEGKILFDFRKRYKNSVLNTLQSNEGIVVKGLKYKGREIWQILIYESYLNQFINELKSKGEIEILGSKDYEIKEDELSPQEVQILGSAYKQGYFDFPRKIKSDEISKKLDMSKSTFSYHIRSIESKIITKYLDDLKFLNTLNYIDKNTKKKEEK